MQSFIHCCHLSVNDILTENEIRSGKFVSKLPKTGNCAKWRIILKPRNSQDGDEEYSSVYLRLLATGRSLSTNDYDFSVDADFAFEVVTKTGHSKIAAGFQGRLSHFVSTRSLRPGKSEYGVKNFCHEFVHLIHDNIEIYNGQETTIKIICKIRMPSDTGFVSNSDRICNNEAVKLHFGEYLYKSMIQEHVDILSDVILVSSDKREFRCHRLLLAASSNVFKAMFENVGNFVKNRRHGLPSIEIDEIDSECLEEILKFVYTKTPNENHLDGKLFENCLYAAEKYMLTDLKNEYVERMKLLLDKENALRYLILADKYEISAVKELAVDLIVTNFDEYETSSEWDEFFETFPQLVKFILRVACRKETVIVCD